ncbi:MAG: ribosome biosis GTPase Der [Bacteroidota bacterium]|jgi:GTP-binding protein
MSNIVAIVGRPNVGKSTFFNRLVGHRQAIMDNVSGVTRDRHYGFAEWQNQNFTIIDTGGYVTGSDDVFEEQIRKQVTLAIDEAHVILFMVDIDAGVTDLDREFANVLRRTKKPIYIVANKADTPAKSNYYGEFYALNIGLEIFTVSAQNGSGTGELLEAVVSNFRDEDAANPHAGIPRFAILGRPNVGKSSMLNALIGQERSIVTDISGTTRDAIDTHYTLFGKNFIITDTAGIRKKAKVTEDIEFYSVLRSLRTLETSDVVIIMIDASLGFQSQDMNLIALAHKNKKGIVLVVNKWDLIEKTTQTAKEFEDSIRAKTAPIDYFPIIFTSVETKQRIFQVLEKAEEVYQNKVKRLSTSLLNDVILHEINLYPPPAARGNQIKIKYLTQLPTNSPTFLLFCNYPKDIIESYQRFLVNKFRKHFGFEGVPITLFFRKK